MHSTVLTILVLVARTFGTGTQQEKMVNPVVLLTGGHAFDLLETVDLEKSVEVFSLNGSCNKDLADFTDRRSGHTTTFFKGDVITCNSCVYNPDACLYMDYRDRNHKFKPLPNSQFNYNLHCDSTATVVDDKLVVVGGIHDAHMKVEANVKVGAGWIILDSLPDELEDMSQNSCAAAIDNDAMLRAGGEFIEWEEIDREYQNVGHATNKMFKYKDGVWQRMESFPGPARANHGCAFVQTPEGDAFLIAGGYSGYETPYLDSSYLYNIESGQWEEVGKLAGPRSGGKIVVVENKVLFLGGFEFEGQNSKWSKKSKQLVDVEEFNVRTKTWSKIPQKIKRRRMGFDAVVIPGALVGC